MLTKNQEKYLATIPEDKIAHIVDFDPGTQTTAEEITAQVKSLLPSAEVFYLGSSALGIAGENDIDLTVLAVNDFNHAYASLKKLYGEPRNENLDDGYAHWEFSQNGFPVELHLNDRMKPYFQEQLDTQKILEQDEGLRFEYELLKRGLSGLPWKAYMRQKYEFWNRILSTKQQPIR